MYNCGDINGKTKGGTDWPAVAVVLAQLMAGPVAFETGVSGLELL